MDALSPADLEAISDRDALDPESYPRESVELLFERGVIQSPLSRELGGDGMQLDEMVRTVEEISAASGSLGLIAAMPFGFAYVIATDASLAPEAHREHWRTQVEQIAADYRAGRIYAACNSEKGAGGSLAATRSTVRKDDSGAFRIDGEKILATAGKNAHTFFSTAKALPAELPGTGVVDLFLVRTNAPGVDILDDWDGFGMRSTESHTVRYQSAPAELFAFPDLFETWQPFGCFYPLFAAVPLGCARAILRELSTPAPTSPALRLRFNEALMRYEALRAYLLETAREWHIGQDASERAKVLRTKTYVSQESTKLAAELFALSGGRSYRRTGRVARALADSFAGTALRPPLQLALETMAESFEFPG